MHRTLHRFRSYLVYALRSGSKRRVSTLGSYLLISLVDGLRLPVRRIRILGRPVRFPSAFRLRQLVEEVVLGRHYAVRRPRTPSPLIVDAGANIGLSSLYFSQLFPGAQLIAIEPHPETVAYLRENLAPVGGVTVKQAALIGERGTRTLTGGGISATVLAEVEVGAETEVEGFPLSDLLGDGRRIDILKLDIEGAELEVLRSVEDRLGEIDQIVGEIHIWAHMDPLPEILSILRRGGHRYELERWGEGEALSSCILRSRRIGSSLAAQPLVHL